MVGIGERAGSPRSGRGPPTYPALTGTIPHWRDQQSAGRWRRLQGMGTGRDAGAPRGDDGDG
jgi:hypothetical protein